MYEIVVNDLIDQMIHEINLGTPSCFGVKREPTFDNHLTLYNQNVMIPLVCFNLYLRTSQGDLQYTQDNFEGQLILDRNGNKQTPARVILFDNKGIPIITSNQNNIQGKIIILGNQAIGDVAPELVGIHAIFDYQNGQAVNSIILSESKDATTHWRIEANMLERV